ncbi:MAG: hypothetical protein LAT83_12000 [Kiritimatiellae bacterium]|nr:hypothetical protein [Kiritimatiellia bacterium]
MAVDLPLLSLLASVPILCVFEQKVAKKAKDFSGFALFSPVQTPLPVSFPHAVIF